MGNHSEDENTSPLKRVRELLKSVSEKITVDANTKVSLGDFIRLLQLERELAEEEQPSEVIVRWVEPSAKHDRVM